MELARNLAVQNKKQPPEKCVVHYLIRHEQHLQQNPVAVALLLAPLLGY